MQRPLQPPAPVGDQPTSSCSCHLAWGCPRRRLVELYRPNLARRCLDTGVGTRALLVLYNCRDSGEDLAAERCRRCDRVRVRALGCTALWEASAR